MVGVDTEPSHVLGAGLPLGELEDVPGQVEAEELVGDGDAVHGDVGLAVAEPLPVDFLIVGILVEHDCGVGCRLVPFQEVVPLVPPLVVEDGRLVGVAVLPLVEALFLHPALRLLDDGHDLLDVVERRVEMDGTAGAQQVFCGFAIVNEGADQGVLASEFFLIRYFVNGFERDLLVVKPRAGIDDVDLVGEFAQTQRRARAHVEHPFVSFPAVFHPGGVSPLFEVKGSVGLHVGGRESELAPVSKPFDDGSGYVVADIHRLK